MSEYLSTQPAQSLMLMITISQSVRQSITYTTYTFYIYAKKNPNLHFRPDFGPAQWIIGNWSLVVHLHKYPRYLNSISLDSVLDWIASNMTSGGTRAVGLTTFKRSGVDISDNLTADKISLAVSPTTLGLAKNQSWTARKISTSAAQNESRLIMSLMPV